MLTSYDRIIIDQNDTLSNKRKSDRKLDMWRRVDYLKQTYCHQHLVIKDLAWPETGSGQLQQILLRTDPIVIIYCPE